MYTLTLIAQKGGTGKTTLAINLSVAAETGGWRTAILDLDPQASAAGWGDQRERDALALVPLHPGILDLRALGTTAEICALARARTAVALNATPHRGPLADQAAEAIAESGLDIAPCRIGARIAFQHSITRGLGVVEHEPAGKAAAEIRTLWRWSRARLED